MVAQIEKNLKQVRKVLDAYPDVRLVGVVKGRSLEQVQALVDSGVKELGNNYFQEGIPLMEKFCSVRWHFIGHLQSRKVKELSQYHLIQTVDRGSILMELKKRFPQGKEILIQVNIGRESQKSGVDPEGLFPLLAKSEGLSVKGLMAMTPDLPAEERRPYFKEMRRLFDEAKRNYSGVEVLSMGMSDDFQIALEEGSNMVRLGSCLFTP